MLYFLDSLFRFHFTAKSRQERDEWVEVIQASRQEFRESMFKVSGQLKVEGK